MRVLWFANVPTPVMAQRAGKGNEGYGGHWIAQLARHVSEVSDIELGVATAYPDMREAHFSEGGVEYFVIPQPRRFHAFGMRSIDIEKCVAVIEAFKPDIIHVHGSERFFGMLKAAGKTDIPTLISIQGLLGTFAKARYFFGALSSIEILRSIRLIELPVGLGLLWQFLNAKRGARREIKILSKADGFLGRTEWDHAHTRQYNPTALYCHVGELLRPAFYRTRWSVVNCRRHTLIYTNAGHPCRGTENLLAVVALLRKEFPDIRLRLAGTVSTRSGYGRFVRRRISKLGLDDAVDFLGYIDDEKMAEELSRAHGFVLASYVENSPNSLAEAMLVGMPCVASFVGGIPSMVSDNDTGLLYPVGDIPLLADKIRSVFLDDDLATRLGNNACSVARGRHDPQVVVTQLMQAYEKILVSSKPDAECVKN